MESTEPRPLAMWDALAPLARERADQAPNLRAQREIGNHVLDFTPEGEDLVVSFDAEGGGTDPNRMPWGYKPFRDQRLAVLGVKPKSADWYRDGALHDFFLSQDFHDLVGAYRQVVFTGASMGGFAALTFCTPGSTVLAHHPQSTLDPTLTSWDERYPESRLLDWSGPFARAEIGASRAAQVFVTYDPFHEIDRRHVNRLDPANLVRLKTPFLGNPMTAYLRRMGLLHELVPLAFSGELTPEWWYAAIRRRRQSARYHLIAATFIEAPEGVARLMARAWKLSEDDRRTQDGIRRQAGARKLGEMFERFLVEEPAKRPAPPPAVVATGPSGPDEELFRRFMQSQG